MARKNTPGKGMTEQAQAIKAVEDKYGLLIFNMGLTYLFDVGARNLDDETVADCIKQIMDEGDANKAAGINTFMTPEFQRAIVNCAAELAKIGIWDLVRYIHKYMTIS